MNRRDKILNKIDLETMCGLEVGPLCSPLIRRDECRVFYVDWTEKEILKEKYAHDKNVDINDIVDIDFVWKDNYLMDFIAGQKIDFVVLSHVVEHFPDFLGRMKQIADVLKPGGLCALAVPDRRVTFDRLRPNSTLSEILEAYREARTKPSFGQIFGYVQNYLELSPGEAWLSNPSDEELRPRRSYLQKNPYIVAQEVFDSGEYMDVHCWTFTSLSFLQICRDSAEIGLFPFSIIDFFPVDGPEFIITLKKEENSNLAVESYSRIINDVEIHYLPYDNLLIPDKREKKEYYMIVNTLVKYLFNLRKKLRHTSRSL